MASPRRMHGITLVELAASLAVAAIVLGMGVPALGHWTARLRAKGTASEVVSSLAFARMSAVSRRVPVTLCPSIDGQRCTGATDWTGGWIAYADPTRDDQPGGPEHILRRFEALPPQVRLTASSGRPRVRFQPEGWAAGTNVTLQVCLGGKPVTRVVLNNAGRARVDESATGACPGA